MRTSNIGTSGFWPLDPERLLNGQDARLRLASLSTIAALLVQEISQPITAAINFIHGSARRLRDGDGVDPDLLAMVEDAGREAMKAGEIVRRMHNFIARGQIIGRAGSLSTMIESVAGDQVCPDGGKASFDTAIGPEADLVAVDRNLIEHVFAILFASACEAMTGHAVRTIAIRASRVGGKVRLRIRDSGPALSEYQYIHLFEPLMTASGPRTGLGMPVARTIVEAHGGLLWAERPSREGAAFCLTLPAAG